MIVFLPGEKHGQRSLAGYSPWSLRESEMTEQLTLSLSLLIHINTQARSNPCSYLMAEHITDLNQPWELSHFCSRIKFPEPNEQG